MFILATALEILQNAMKKHNVCNVYTSRYNKIVYVRRQFYFFFHYLFIELWVQKIFKINFARRKQIYEKKKSTFKNILCWE